MNASVQISASGHDAGKLRRRRAIIDAAHDIITHEGDAALTMRRLAIAAGVSVPTPYNLFGSKEAVLRAVMDDDQQDFVQQLRQGVYANPLVRIFDIIDDRFAAYGRKPTFYRALLRLLYQARQSDKDQSLWVEHAGLGAELIREAIAAGFLLGDESALMERTLVRLYHAASLEWVSDEIGLEMAHREVGLTMAIFLSAFVAPPHRPVIEQIRARYER